MRTLILFLLSLACSAQTFNLHRWCPLKVYAGDAIYCTFTVEWTTAQFSHVYFDSFPSGMPPNTTGQMVSCDTKQDCWNPSAPFVYVDHFFRPSFQIKFQTAANTPPGTYRPLVRIRSAGYTHPDVTLEFTVEPQPSPITFQGPPIGGPPPDISTWRTKMTQLGDAFCYTGGGGEQAGSPKRGSTLAFGDSSQIWYYDGARVYYQIADYTGNAAYWKPCAEWIADQYRNYIQTTSGTQGYKIFPHGIERYYRETGDSRFKDAVGELVTDSAFGGSVRDDGLISDFNIREAAYLLQSSLAARRLGLAPLAREARLVDYMLGHITVITMPDQFAFTTSSYIHNHQSFYDGLSIAALIEYFDYTRSQGAPDWRVPARIKELLDWDWDRAWDAAIGRLQNTQFATKVCDTNIPSWQWFQCADYGGLGTQYNWDSLLINLLAPAYAWYAALTGNPVYRDRADDMFKHAYDKVIWSGKEFDQSYRWSFDLVRWRQQWSQGRRVRSGVKVRNRAKR